MSRFENDFEKIVAGLNVPLQQNPEHRRRLRQQMLTAFVAADDSSQPPTKTRRFKMNRFAKIAAAIIVFVGIPLGIVFLLQGPGTATVAWADVQQKVRDIQTVTFKAVVQHSATGKMEVYAMVMEPDLVRQEITMGPLQMTHIMDMGAGQILVLTHDDKTAIRVNVPSLPEAIRQQYEDSDFLAKFKDMVESPESELGEKQEKQINGRLAKGYHVEKDNQVMDIWVDAETAEPLEVQIDMYGPEVKLTLSDFQFNKDLDKSLFSLEIPPGYKEPLGAPMEIGDASTEDLADFFRFWAEARGGTFPDTLAEAEWVDDCLEHMQALEKQVGTEEYMKRVTGFGRARLFLQIQKEAHYHYAGAGVALGDADTPIFWYRPKDAETYDVIYGDLTVKQLPEASLPK